MSPSRLLAEDGRTCWSYPRSCHRNHRRSSEAGGGGAGWVGFGGTKERVEVMSPVAISEVEEVEGRCAVVSCSRRRSMPGMRGTGVRDEDAAREWCIAR